LQVGQRLEKDSEAEVAQTADIAPCRPLGVAFVEVVLAELAVGGVCGEHVIDADDKLMSNRQGGAAAAAAALELVVLGLEEAAALARGGDGGVAQGGLEIRVAGAGAGRLALAGALVIAGQAPVQAARWPALGKTDMSTPISAMTVAVTTQSIPEIVISRASCAA
jgi:hypothetical protein